MRMKRRMMGRKNARKNALPAQTSFGGSLNFGSSLASSYSSIIPARPSGSSLWQIDCINGTSIISKNAFKNGIDALQIQIDQHFAPAWNIGANLKIVNQVTQGNVTIYVLDTTQEADILGYHDVTLKEVPVGFVFAKTSQQSGESWTYTMSHEILELLGDPYANLAAEGQFAGAPAFFAYENCDAVEGDEGYKINGVQVANFLFPSWFVNQTATQYDCLQNLDAPFTIGSGGYLSYFRAIGDWIDVTDGSQSLLRKTHSKYSRHFKRRKKANPNHGIDHKHPKFIPHPHTHDKTSR